MIILSKELMQEVNACNIGPDFFTELNLWGLEESLVLQKMNEANMTAERDWWLSVKKTAAGMEAIKRHCNENYYTLGEYRVCSPSNSEPIHCENFELAKVVAHEQLLQHSELQTHLFVVNHLAVDDEGNHTVKIVENLNSTDLLDSFTVFNPLTGITRHGLNLAQAKSQLAENKAAWVAANRALIQIEQAMHSIEGATAWRRVYW